MGIVECPKLLLSQCLGRAVDVKASARQCCLFGDGVPVLIRERVGRVYYDRCRARDNNTLDPSFLSLTDDVQRAFDRARQYDLWRLPFGQGSSNVDDRVNAFQCIGQCLCPQFQSRGICRRTFRNFW